MVVVQASVSRIGGRAYPEAMRDLAQSVRLLLAQAADAARYATDPRAAEKAREDAARYCIALSQLPGHPTPLEEQAR